MPERGADGFAVPISPSLQPRQIAAHQQHSQVPNSWD
jgi:SHAQKYF class myb-like DNA-binding protein